MKGMFKLCKVFILKFEQSQLEIALCFVKSVCKLMFAGDVPDTSFTSYITSWSIPCLAVTLRVLHD